MSVELGKPISFDVDKFVECVEMFCNADEVQIALHMLDNMPGYYRDNPPKQCIDLKQKIYSKIVTVKDYMNYDGESFDKCVQKEKAFYGDLFNGISSFIDLSFCYPRAQVLIDVLQKYNDESFIPHIIEMGPSNYWIPHGLPAKGLNFTYEPITINKIAMDDHIPRIPQYQLGPTPHQPVVFVCFETIEHLWHPDDIYHYYARQLIDANVILMSTPKYTLMGGHPEGMNRLTIEHLRTWTPHEFLAFTEKHFKGYSWLYYDADMMVLKGTKI